MKHSSVDVIEDVEGGQVEAQGGLTAGLQLLQQGLAVAEQDLSVLLLVSFLHSFVVLRVFLQIFVEEKVPVNNTEVIKQ